MTTWGKTSLKGVIADLIRDLLRISINSYSDVSMYQK